MLFKCISNKCNKKVQENKKIIKNRRLQYVFLTLDRREKKSIYLFIPTWRFNLKSTLCCSTCILPKFSPLVQINKNLKVQMPLVNKGTLLH